jgi:protein-disulfide isomerase
VATKFSAVKNALDLAVTICMMAACIAIVLWISRTTGGTSANALGVTERTVGISGAPIKGARTARAGVLIFSDFDCPYCSSFALDRLDSATGHYIAERKLLVAFRNLPLAIHPNAKLAAVAATCAGEQGGFWRMHDWLFANPARRTLSSYEQWATTELGDGDRFSACIEADGPSVVKADIDEAKALGVTSTPTVFVGVMRDEATLSVVRQFVGLPDTKSFEDAIHFSVQSGADRLR